MTISLIEMKIANSLCLSYNLFSVIFPNLVQLAGQLHKENLVSFEECF